jgi:hypothetical protein
MSFPNRQEAKGYQEDDINDCPQSDEATAGHVRQYSHFELLSCLGIASHRRLVLRPLTAHATAELPQLPSPSQGARHAKTNRAVKCHHPTRVMT